MKTGERFHTFAHPKILHQPLSQGYRTKTIKTYQNNGIMLKPSTWPSKSAQARGFKPGISIRAAVFSAGRHWEYHSLSLGKLEAGWLQNWVDLPDECLISFNICWGCAWRTENKHLMTEVKCSTMFFGQTLVPKTGSYPIAPKNALPICGQVWGRKMRIHHSTRVREGFSWLQVGWR